MEEDETIVNDLPSNYTDTIADRLDANFRTYFLQEKGNSVVNVEKWSVRKKDYFAGKLGRSRGRPHANQYLIKEDSFTDIGGGRMTFLRHFAQLPEPWFDYEQKSVRYYQGYTFSGVGYDSKYGRHGFPYSAYATRNVPFVTKATRYYVTKSTMDAFLTNRYTLSGQFSNGNWLYPDGISDNLLTTSGITYPVRLFVNSPRVSLGSGDATPVAIAPDRVTLWKPNIYEITRYEASINHKINQEGSEGIPIIFRWIFNAGAFEQTKRNGGTLRVDFSATDGHSSSNSTYGVILNYPRYMKRLTSVSQQNTLQTCNVKVTSTTGLKVVANFLGGGIFENPLEESADQNFKLKWDGVSAQINVTFVIG